ncbi:MAG: hypothetical protein QOE77_4033 [Blastocatellia bacterium]|nr:hypothetical protein [Blastocatellia bacterium]
MAERPDTPDSERQRQAANLFDLRRIIGGLFILYGLILVVLGIGDSQAEIDKAAGVHINLLTGIGMLVVGALFLVWAFTRPLGDQLAEAERSDSDEGGRGTGRDRERAGGDDDARPE